VWSPAHGDGVVAHIEGAATEKPVRVSFVDRSGEKIVLWYREDGSKNPLDVGPSLFHAGTHIVEAPEPKRKPKGHEFKTGDKVLVRDVAGEVWSLDFYSHSINRLHGCVGGCWFYCIPYEGNEHLLCTTDSPEGE
jgi:hypothetical protein